MLLEVDNYISKFKRMPSKTFIKEKIKISFLTLNTIIESLKEKNYIQSTGWTTITEHGQQHLRLLRESMGESSEKNSDIPILPKPVIFSNLTATLPAKGAVNTMSQSERNQVREKMSIAKLLN